MPRKNLIRTPHHYYHITTRANNKEWFALPLREIWSISQTAFNKSQENAPAIVSQFVLMGNHYHLLIKTPNSDIDIFMFWFNKTFSDLLRKKSGRINRMFGSNYKWSLIQDPSYLFNVVRYVYQNPIRAGVVSRCEDYPFSTLYYKKRNKDPGFKVEFKIEFDSLWEPINTDLPLEEIDLIRSGLRKSVFKPNSNRKY